jgi:hypothetical protein
LDEATTVLAVRPIFRPDHRKRNFLPMGYPFRNAVTAIAGEGVHILGPTLNRACDARGPGIPDEMRPDGALGAELRRAPA